MNAQQQTAPIWRDGRGEYGKAVGSANFTPISVSPQIAAILSEMAATTATVDAGLTLINEARKAAAASISNNGKCHFNADRKSVV